MRNWPRACSALLDSCNRRRWACATEIVILGMEHHLPTQYSCAAGELVAIRSVHSDIDDVNRAATLATRCSMYK